MNTLLLTEERTVWARAVCCLETTQTLIKHVGHFEKQFSFMKISHIEAQSKSWRLQIQTLGLLVNSRDCWASFPVIFIAFLTKGSINFTGPSSKGKHTGNATLLNQQWPLRNLVRKVSVWRSCWWPLRSHRKQSSLWIWIYGMRSLKLSAFQLTWEMLLMSSFVLNSSESITFAHSFPHSNFNGMWA